MEKSKLISLLRTFDFTEAKQFKDFVASPYYNKNADLLPFIEYLEPFIPEFPPDKIKKENVYAGLYPGRPFDGKHLAYLMNYLNKLAERFIAVRHYEEQTFLADYHMAREFVRRRQEKHYNFVQGRTLQQLRDHQARSSDYFYFQYQFSELASDVNFHRGNRSFDPDFQLAADSLDDFYFFNKLRFGCEMLNRQKIFSADYRLRFLEEITTYLSRRESLPPIIDLLLHTYLTLENPADDRHFESLMELLRRHGTNIDREELRMIYLYSINHSVRNISKGSLEYIPMALDLYLEGIRSHALFENDHLTHSTYTNVIKLALMQRRYDWIENFINNYSDFLSPSFREDALYYNLAELHYHRRNYDRVLDNLNQLQFSDIQYHLGSRVILIKTYYELDETDALLSLLASFSVYLRRNKKISTPLKKRYLNFCNLLHHILRRDAKKRERLRQQIDTIQPLAERGWLQEVWEGAPVVR